MVCANCGSLIKDEVDMCPFCGNSLSESKFRQARQKQKTMNNAATYATIGMIVVIFAGIGLFSLVSSETRGGNRANIEIPSSAVSVSSEEKRKIAAELAESVSIPDMPDVDRKPNESQNSFGKRSESEVKAWKTTIGERYAKMRETNPEAAELWMERAKKAIEDVEGKNRRPGIRPSH